ncbi:MAG TPA: ABC transporter permease [Actinomycetota bacterium]|nr:ABC transporter permease [Actinomycetota bacterium]
MTAPPEVLRRTVPFLEELRKLPAFLRRDFLVMWSYRLAFFVDWANLVAQVVIFSLVGRLVDPRLLPTFGGRPTSYVEFVVTGIAVASFLQIALGRVVNAIREEQLMGTLESLLVTPTSPLTIQLGSVMYDLAYVPIRTVVFLAAASALLGARLDPNGLVPVIAILLVFIPVVWGLGMVAAAAVLTFRRGAGALGFVVMVLMIGSNTYFPIDILPEWARSMAALNPISIAVEGTRSALLGGEGWASIWPSIRLLLPMAVSSLLIGLGGLKLALRRERRRGTLGLY